MELDNIIENFIKEITIEDIDKILEYKNTEGKIFEKRMEGLIIHMFNHETHHRAMISLYLEMLGKENDYNNILPMLSNNNKNKKTAHNRTVSASGLKALGVPAG
jgi:uncharacterized damage-inducible protein DinB